MAVYKCTDSEKRALGTYVKLMRASETITMLAHQHLATHNLTTSQFGVLEALYHLGPMCQKDIGNKILKSSGNITTVVDNLEKRNLVKRNRTGSDRRFISVELTSEGRALIHNIFPSHVEGISDLLSALSAQEQKDLAELCRKLGRQQQAPSGEITKQAER